MSEQIYKQVRKQRRPQPEIEELPEPLDETELKALADLAIEHIDEALDE